MGKSVGHETKSVATKGAKKLDKGMDVRSKKIYGTPGDNSNAETPDQTNRRGAAAAQPAPSPNTPR
jgi:hypothetical protein